MIGTFVSICSVSALAMKRHVWSADARVGLVTALVAALAANVSIVGLNQCCDIDLDRVNKPYLPLASGEWSAHTGWLVSGLTGVLAVGIAYASASAPLLATVVGSILLGIVYSVQLPFMRWKKSPLAAAACIVTVRSLLVQVRPTESSQ
jgi:homogentisate phytyltransferase / homogentisate geranylgeranyltransferase